MTTYADDVDCHKVLIEKSITGQPIVAKMDVVHSLYGKRRIMGSYGRVVAISALSGKLYCAAGYNEADRDYCLSIMALAVPYEPFVSVVAANAIFGINDNNRVFGNQLAVPSDPNVNRFWAREPYGAYHINGRTGFSIITARPNILAALTFTGILEGWGGDYGYGASGPNWGAYLPIKAMATRNDNNYCWMVGIKENGYAVKHHSETGGVVPYWSFIQSFNGNIVDIWATNRGTHLLCDDGTVKSIGDSLIDTSLWANVIKICGVARALMGLKDDGTVYYSGSDTGDVKIIVETWTDIIDIALQSSLVGIGVKADGSLVIAGNTTVWPVWQWVKTWNLN